MAKLEFEGISEYITSLERIAGKADGVAKKALYEGAAVVADEVRAAVNALPTDEKWGTRTNPANGIRAEQKEALAAGLGLASFQKDGDMINTLLGFSGYSTYKTKKFPNGQPLALIARVAESGTSFTKKAPFFRKAVNKAKQRATAEMAKVFEDEINKMKE